MDEVIIGRVPLFQNLPPTELAFLARTLRRHQLEQGQVLFREGEPGDRFYIVRNGQLEVIKANGTPEESVVGVRGPGEYVGEMSLFNPSGLRSAMVRSRTVVDVLEMTRSDLDALLARRPDLAYEMVRVLTMRLDEAHNQSIQELSEKNHLLTAAYQPLLAAQAEIVLKEKLEHELKLAREVQASLLPQAVPVLPGWEFAARWQPSNEVSGDYYDFIPPLSARTTTGINLEGCWGLVIADVSGKGMPAALYMALTRSILRSSVANTGTPADHIAHTNKFICADSANGMFVTMFYGLLDPATATLTYVNAGHDQPWHYRAVDDDWRPLEPTGMALGFFQSAAYQQHTIPLAPGDAIIHYTDGVTDAANPEHERFGSERLLGVIHENRRRPASELVAALEAALRQFSGSAPLFDDVTLVVARRSPAPTA